MPYFQQHASLTSLLCNGAHVNKKELICLEAYESEWTIWTQGLTTHTAVVGQVQSDLTRHAQFRTTVEAYVNKAWLWLHMQQLLAG